MKTQGFDVQKCQHGWICEWFYLVTTTSQFTDVGRSAQGGSRYLAIAIVKAWWIARQLERAERATASERAAKGWAP